MYASQTGGDRLSFNGLRSGPFALFEPHVNSTNIVLAATITAADLAAEPFSPADNRKSLIARAARTLHLTYSRAKRIWYAEDTCSMRAEEVVRLLAERERLYRVRLARLRAEIADTERLINEALRREKQAQAAEAVGSSEAGAGAQSALSLGGCQ